jgi:hypothetical protein
MANKLNDIDLSVFYENVLNANQLDGDTFTNFLEKVNQFDDLKPQFEICHINDLVYLITKLYARKYPNDSGLKTVFSGKEERIENDSTFIRIQEPEIRSDIARIECHHKQLKPHNIYHIQKLTFYFKEQLNKSILISAIESALTGLEYNIQSNEEIIVNDSPIDKILLSDNSFTLVINQQMVHYYY